MLVVISEVKEKERGRNLVFVSSLSCFCRQVSEEAPIGFEIARVTSSDPDAGSGDDKLTRANVTLATQSSDK